MKRYITFIKESYDDPFEKEFLSLSHLDELEIKIDFIIYPKDLFYFYNKHLLFDIYSRNNGIVAKKHMYINGYEIFDELKVIKRPFNIDPYEQLNTDIKSFIFKYFKYDLSVDEINTTCDSVEQHFN